MYRVWNFLTNYSLLLIIGALIALVWANIDADSYHHFVEFKIWDHAPIGHYHDGHRTLTLHYLVNDVFMALFFAIAAKEVWEAVILKNGSLARKESGDAALCDSGRHVWPDCCLSWSCCASRIGNLQRRGKWLGYPNGNGYRLQLSCRSDRLWRRPSRRAVPALAGHCRRCRRIDHSGHLLPLGRIGPGMAATFAGGGCCGLCPGQLAARAALTGTRQDRPTSTWVRKTLSFWPYVVAGCVSWYGFMSSGLHPALGLLPIVPTIPHADRAFGIFSAAEQYLTDLLNQMEHALKTPVEIVLFFFGLCNAGVEFSSIGDATWLVLAGLLIGKPVGVLIMGWIAARPLGLGIPEGMRIIDLVVIGCVAAIGFTVSLFFAGAAFDAGPVQDAAKMGALFSFVAALISIAAGIICRVEKQPG